MAGPVILLGAGASIDAGLPDAFRLTEVIYNELAQPINSQQAILFGYVISKLRARRVLLGGSPFERVNVEEAYDALLRVINKDDDILSEFVSGWDPIFDFIKPKFDENRFMKGIIESVQDQSRSSHSHIISIDQHRLREAAQAISSSMNRDDNKTRAAQTVAQYIDILVKILSSASGENEYFDILAEFVQRTNAAVATLNYDVLFEESCRRNLVDFDYGLARWNDRQMTDWRTPATKIFKLHGSINWTGSPEQILISDEPAKPERWRRSNALLIFGGQSGKLTPDGPFLQLRNDFEKSVMKTNRLLIVGYSFGDKHINSILRKWVSTRVKSKMVIVDPGPINFGLNVFQNSFDSKLRKKSVEIVHVKKTAADGMSDAVRECCSRVNSKYETGKNGFLPHILVKTIK